MVAGYLAKLQKKKKIKFHFHRLVAFRKSKFLKMQFHSQSIIKHFGNEFNKRHAKPLC